jgi:hypothetical protein
MDDKSSAVFNKFGDLSTGNAWATKKVWTGVECMQPQNPIGLCLPTQKGNKILHFLHCEAQIHCNDRLHYVLYVLFTL